ncbi:MAG: putative nitroreductase YdjA [Pseudomonadota bacterium]
MSGSFAGAESRAALDFAALLKGRRTIHEFTPEAVPEAPVLEALELACWVPNHHRTEPWRFYLLGEVARARVIDLNTELVRASKGDAAAEAKRRRWNAMSGWLVLTCQLHEDSAREREDYAACCCAAQNLALGLWSQGIGLKWGTGKVIRTPGFLDIIGADPKQEFAVGLFWYGYPAEVPQQARRPVRELTRIVA